MEACGNRDEEKSLLVAQKYSNAGADGTLTKELNLRKVSQRFPVSLAAWMDEMENLTRDINQAYENETRN